MPQNPELLALNCEISHWKSWTQANPIQTKETINAFAAAYETMNRWRKMDDKTEMLIIGVDNFAFPIPLTKN